MGVNKIRNTSLTTLLMANMTYAISNIIGEMITGQLHNKQQLDSASVADVVAA